VYCFFAIVHLDELAFCKCLVECGLVQREKKSCQLSELPQLLGIDIGCVVFGKAVYEESHGFIAEQDDGSKTSRLASALPSDPLFEDTRAKIGVD